MSLFGSIKSAIASPKDQPKPVSSPPGAGSAESITLRAQKASEATTTYLRRSKPRFLFVNDDPTRLRELERMLQPLRYEWDVVFAPNSASALELMARVPFDGVVCDVRPDGTSLSDLLDQIETKYPKALRFKRCACDRKRTLSDFTSNGPLTLSIELDAAELAEEMIRALRLSVWLTDGSARKLMSQMQRLPSLPMLYNQVVAELNSSSASLEFVGKLIAKDPGITAKILQAINSPVFGLARRIADPTEAVMFLGTERTKGLILSASMFLQFDKNACRGFSHEQLWQHSIATASFASTIMIAETKDKKIGETAYTTGLLHDVGKLLLAANIPRDYARVLEQAERRGVSIPQVEQEALGATHAELGASVLGVWGLPVSMLDAIAWHHRPLASNDKIFTLLTAVHVANAIDRERKDERDGHQVNRMDKEYLEQLGLEGQRNRWRELCGCSAKTDLDENAQRLRLRQEAREN